MNEPIPSLPRMLIIWNWLPCNNTGAGILMRRLFDRYPPNRLWALTTARVTRTTASYDPLPPPDRQAPAPQIQINRRVLYRLASLLNFLLIPWIVWRGVRLVRKEKIEAIFTVPWNNFTISAYFINKITRLPLYMYIMDDPAGTRRFGLLPPVYAMLMPRVLRSSRRIWGVSDDMCEYFEKTYGVRSETLLPLVDIESFRRKSANEATRVDDSLHIIFTGAIYSAQVDAVRRLVHVVNRDRSEPARMRLTLYTSVAAEALEKMDLSGTNVRRDEVTPENIPSVIAEADVAFLPLSFHSDMRHIVETSFPSKTAEYLAAGIPVLVHAPSYSAVARYCSDRGCGLVVDEPNEDALLSALLRLVRDAKLRRELSEKALETAKRNHDAARVVPTFLNGLR